MSRLNAKPTFWAKVEIPVPGGESPLVIEFEFVHRTVKQLQDFGDAGKRRDDGSIRTDAEIVLGAAKAWRSADITEPFDKESVEKLCENFHSAGSRIAAKYIEELTQQRLGN